MNKTSRKRILPQHIFCKRIVLSVMFLFAITLLTACGGGGGGGGDTSTANTGTFIDSPVQGLDYLTTTQKGTTNSQGSFTYETGEEITFSIGDVVLGTTLGKSIITPLDLVPGAQDETDPTVTNILRLLQSLDVDGDPDNSIYLTSQIVSEVSGRQISFDTSVENFGDGEMADLFGSLNDQGAFSGDTPRALRGPEEAQEHFRQVMDEPADPTELAAIFSIFPEMVIVIEPVTFDASESTGAISEYLWDFGDGETGSGVETTHTFAETGPYLVTLTVVDESGKEASSTQEITVNMPPNEPPVAKFTPNPTTDEAPALISFVPTGSSDPDGTIVLYTWDYGDGKTINGRVARHTYDEPGNYLVKLTVTDNEGATGEATFELIITGPSANQAPTASFTANPATGEAPLQVAFNGTASAYSWDFDDGQVDGGATINHTYTEPGTYTAVLTVTDDDGATAESSQLISVSEGASEPDCSTNPCDDNATCDDSGEEIICTCNTGWTGNGFSCSIVDECENNDTLPGGGSACGLNDRGELGLKCVGGEWQDNPDVCTDLDVCTDDSVTDGSTACGFNDNGTLMQVCTTGQWIDSDDCDDPDVCTNSTTQKGSTACSGGFYLQLCEDGQWSDTTDCILDGADDDGDLVDAADDPNDADNTVCGDSDSDGCDDCSVAGIFDPANDGWDENGDGTCELPLDYDCMNGANAATDPYRLQACIQFTYVNQDRDHFADESGNAAPIRWNEYIWEVAVAHSIDMCESVFFAHTNLSGQNPSDRANAAGLSYGLAENIAINHDPGAAQYAFMEEPTCVGHRANVLEPKAIQAGIGYHICNNPSNTQWNGAHFVTQNFRWNFSIGASAYCQNPANVCQIPPNPPTTAPCPPDLIAWGLCPVPSEDTLLGWGCN
jgi:PKD repeat protein